jgi:hypothetical protein
MHIDVRPIALSILFSLSSTTTNNHIDLPTIYQPFKMPLDLANPDRTINVGIILTGGYVEDHYRHNSKRSY